jgi:uncharacterized protein
MLPILWYTFSDMTLKQRIDQDLKQAMLAGHKDLVTTLRGLKSSILNIEVAEGKRDTGLSDEEVIVVLQKEAKRRQESADMYAQGGKADKAEAEQAEKAVIERYLPAQLSESEIATIVDEVIAQTDASGMQAMGQVIGGVKQKVGASADGAVIARIVKEKLTK